MRAFICLLYLLSLSCDMQASTLSRTPLSVQTLTEKVGLGVYRYNYKNYHQKLNALRPAFTPAGWHRFKRALADTHDIEFVKEHAMQVTSQILKRAFLVKRIGGSEWLYKMKLRVCFKNQKMSRQNDLWVHVKVARYKNLRGQTHLGIKKIVAYPVSLERLV